MWSVVKWRKWDMKDERWDYYYSTVPNSWIQGKDSSKPILLWPTANKNIIEKLRKQGLPFSGPTEENSCKIIATGFDNFLQAIAEEIEIHRLEKDILEVTTDAETQDERKIESHNVVDDFTEMATNLANINDIKNTPNVISNETNEPPNDAKSASEASSFQTEVTRTESNQSSNVLEDRTEDGFPKNTDSLVLSDFPVSISCSICKYTENLFG